MLTIGAFLLGAVLTTQSAVVDTTNHALVWYTGYSDEAVQNDYFSVQGADGKWHFGCTIEIDKPSSHLMCGDGFHEES